MTTPQPVPEFFAIGEVCSLTGLRPHVLRYWEGQFRVLRPTKNRAGNRIYRGREVEVILLIKHLLYTEKFTIDGARLRLDQLRRTGELKTEARAAAKVATLSELRQELDIIQGVLDGSVPPGGAGGARVPE